MKVIMNVFNKKMIVEIFTSYRYGSWVLSFGKEFDLPFVPFIGLEITVGDDLTIPFTQNEYNSCRISYDVVEQKFTVDRYTIWRHPVADDEVDLTIASFEEHCWKRWDSTDVESFKKLMRADYERSKRTGTSVWNG